MELKKGKIKVKEIQSLNQALSEIANMLVDPEIMMDLGIIKAEHKVILTEFEKSKKELVLKTYKEFGVDENTKDINQILITKLEDKLNQKIESLLEKEYDVQFPVFSKKELSDWANEDKKSKDERAFKPSLNFYSNISGFVV
jgi:hypothetical protein